MAFWLMKSEPSSYSWQQLEKDGRTHWSGVRNFQASNNLKAMRLEDRAFFYHSNEGLAVVGIMTVVREYYPDPGDQSGRFGMVDVAPLRPFVRPVELAAIKAEPRLKDMLLVRNSRLSVSPVEPAAWKLICKMGGTAP